MIEELTITTEIDGAVQEVDVTFRYYGLTDFRIDKVYIDGVEVEGLSFAEEQSIMSQIFAHKTNPNYRRAVV